MLGRLDAALSAAIASMQSASSDITRGKEAAEARVRELQGKLEEADARGGAESAEVEHA